MKIHKVVFVGAGARGGHWIKVIKKDERYEPIALVDPSKKSLEKALNDNPDIPLKTFSSVSEAAKNIKADVAIIAAPSTYRLQTCFDVINAKWHLFVEKPLAFNLRDAVAIVNQAEEAGLALTVGQSLRFFPHFQKIKNLIDNDNFGEIGHGVFVRHRRRYAGNTYQKNMRHNYLLEMGIHDLDLIRFHIGLKPEKVFGFSFLPDWGDFNGETTVSALWEFQNKVRVNYFGAWASHVPELTWRIDGGKGTVRYSEGYGKNAELLVGQPNDGLWKSVLIDENQFKESSENLLDEFDSAINEGLPTTTNGRENLWTVAMIQALVDSTQNSGGPISISDMMEKHGA